MNTLRLQTPIMINGKEIKELTYNTAKITVSQFLEAESRSSLICGNARMNTTTHHFDHGFHVYLGMMAIITENPQVDVTDLERLNGYDVVQLANIGRDFIFAGAGGNSEGSTSGDTSEITPELTAQAQEKYGDIPS